jgi:hypothetical protein
MSIRRFLFVLRSSKIFAPLPEITSYHISLSLFISSCRDPLLFQLFPVCVYYHEDIFSCIGHDFFMRLRKMYAPVSNILFIATERVFSNIEHDLFL